MAPTPSLVGILPALCYTMTYLDRAFAETFAGEDRPPRWPELNVWEQIRSGFMWVAAIACGAAVGGLPAWLFWSRTVDPGNLDRVVVTSLITFGAVYAQGALAAGLLFEDVMAMNPVTVLKAMRGMGTGSLRTLGYATAWLASWAFAVHETLVATRIRGVECRRRARGLGWFCTRSQRS